MTTIPRDEIRVIADRYRNNWLIGDHRCASDRVDTEVVRELAVEARRYAADPAYDWLTPEQYEAEANDLDALVDRYERESS